MFPGIFEWVWDAGHLIFFGIFWMVIAALILGIVLAISKTLAELKREARESEFAWDGPPQSPSKKQTI